MLLVLSVLFVNYGCKKLIAIKPEVGTIEASEVFSNDGDAASAVLDMYSTMLNTDNTYASGSTTYLCGMSADELIPFDQSTGQDYIQFRTNQLNSDDPNVNSSWKYIYSTIYQANSILDGLNNYGSGVHASVRSELIGEAEFTRAFCDFYLVNLFGEVPLVSTLR